jgi:acyl carrier protein
MNRTYDDILAQTYETLGRFAKGRPLTEDTDLVTDLDLDSMDVMEVVFEAEDRFDVSIPMNVLPSVRTVRDFAMQLQELTAK